VAVTAQQVSPGFVVLVGEQALQKVAVPPGGKFKESGRNASEACTFVIAIYGFVKSLNISAGGESNSTKEASHSIRTRV
jgi:hypothetical protein